MMDLNSTKVFVVYKVYLKIENKNEAISEFIRSVCVWLCLKKEKTQTNLTLKQKQKMNK